METSRQKQFLCCLPKDKKWGAPAVLELTHNKMSLVTSPARHSRCHQTHKLFSMCNFVRGKLNVGLQQALLVKQISVGSLEWEYVVKIVIDWFIWGKCFVLWGKLSDKDSFFAVCPRTVSKEPQQIESRPQITNNKLTELISPAFHSEVNIYATQSGSMRSFFLPKNIKEK